MSDLDMIDLAFNVFGQPIVVRAPAQHSNWHARLRDLMGPYNAPRAMQPAEVIGVELMDDDLPWHVTYDKYTNMLANEDQLLQHLEWRIFSVGVLYASATLSLHAGAAACEGKAVLLTGESGSGKTTLTLALTSRGWQMLTDDVSLIEMHGNVGIVQPCARCCHLSADSLSQLTAKQVVLEGPIGGLPEYFRQATQGRATPIGWIVTPRYAPKEELSLTRLTQAETAALMIHGGLRQMNRTVREQWAAAITIASHIPGYRLIFPSLDAGLAALAHITGAATP